MNRNPVYLIVLLISASASTALAGDQTVPRSPAERRIRSLEQAIRAQPEQHRLYSELAVAWARRARETANPEFYEKGRDAAEEALRRHPNDFEARRALLWILLGQHEFSQAYKLATELNRQVPDDLQVYGMLADACVELGRYDEAERAVQWMLDMRPGAVSGLTRAAYLRELFGDLEGSLQLLEQSFRNMISSESEERAWIAVHIGRVQRHMGRNEDAERSLQVALRLFPGYHYALFELAEVRTAQGRHQQAVELLEQRYQKAPHPENIAHLAAALERAGQSSLARKRYAEFERAALEESANWDNANRELITYYLGPGKKPAAGLRIARMEYQRRQDVHTLALYARALRANGRGKEGDGIARKALSLGSKDPDLLNLLAVKER